MPLLDAAALERVAEPLRSPRTALRHAPVLVQQLAGDQLHGCAGRPAHLDLRPARKVLPQVIHQQAQLRPRHLDWDVGVNDADRSRSLGPQRSAGACGHHRRTPLGIVKTCAIPVLSRAPRIEILAAIGRGENNRAGRGLPAIAVIRSLRQSNCSTANCTIHIGGP